MSVRAKIKTRARIRALKVHSISVVRSKRHIRAQLMSPTGEVITGMSTLAPELSKKVEHGGNCDAATALGKAFAKKVAKLKVGSVAFDRSGYIYHGRVKAFAEALREAEIIA